MNGVLLVGTVRMGTNVGLGGDKQQKEQGHQP